MNPKRLPDLGERTVDHGERDARSRQVPDRGANPAVPRPQLRGLWPRLQVPWQQTIGSIERSPLACRSPVNRSAAIRPRGRPLRTVPRPDTGPIMTGAVGLSRRIGRFSERGRTEPRGTGLDLIRSGRKRIRRMEDLAQARAGESICRAQSSLSARQSACVAVAA